MNSAWKGRGSESWQAMWEGCGKAHQAAIGMPAALKNWRGREHVRNFIAMALADGTPLDDLVLLAEELARETRPTKRF